MLIELGAISSNLAIRASLHNEPPQLLNGSHKRIKEGTLVGSELLHDRPRPGISVQNLI